MSKGTYKEELRQRYMAKAEAIFEVTWARGEGAGLTLSQIEETVGELKFELTRLLVESMVEVQARRQKGPGPRCERCGGEMYSKGKRRRRVVTSQGEIEVVRRYHYCDRCGSGFFPPGQATGAGASGVE
jgi:YgiT-type zinc finger domain-containing protein